MRLLPVKVPDAPRHRGDTVPARLARNVAPLFGVDWPGNPKRCAWLCDYDTLTLGEIGRGAPLPTREWHTRESAFVTGRARLALGQTPRLPRGRWAVVERALVEGVGDEGALPDPAFGELVEAPDELAPATLNRFGPDRKAAAVLIGANALFAPLLPVFREVIGMIGTLDSGTLVAPVIRVAIWAHLVQQVYRSEPVLFAAAVQARAIQRALVNEITVDLLDDLPTARCELGDAQVAAWDEVDRAHTPRSLSILDATFEELRLDTLGDLRNEPSHGYIADDLIDRWTRYLLHSRDRGLLWAEEPSPGRRRAEVFAPVIGLASGLVDDLSLVLPRAEPAGLGDDGDDGDDGDGEQTTGGEGWRILLPRIPSPGELARFDRTTQRATLWSLHQIHRLLRENPQFSDRDLEIEVTRAAAAVADLATRVLGPADPMTQVVTARRAAYDVMELREGGLDAALAATGRLVDALGRMRELHDRGDLPAGSLAEQIWSLSAPLQVVAADLAQAGREADAAGLFAELGRWWQVFFDALRVDLDSEIAADAVSPRALELSPHLHHYAAMLLSLPDEASRARGIALQERIVLPARRQILADRRSDGPLRSGLQVLVRGFARQVADLDAAGRSDEATALARRALPYVEELSALPSIRRRLDPSYVCGSSRGAAALVTLVDGWLMLAEHGLTSPHVDLAAAGGALDAVAAFTGAPHEHETTFSTYVLSERAVSVAALSDRLAALPG